MASTKKIAAVAAVTCALTGCSGIVKEGAIQPAYLHTPSGACLKSLHRKLEELTGISGIHLSSTPFANGDTLLLTNHPRRHSPSDDPLVGVVGSEIVVKLFSQAERCMIAILDAHGGMRASAVLDRCRCEKVAPE